MKNEKQVNKNLFNERSLFLLNIRELRVIGRKLGVPAPATLKKQELVDYILKIVYGDIEPPKRSSCGRPSVREVDVNSYMTKIMKKTDFDGELTTASAFDVDSIFKVASAENKSQTKDVETKTFVEDGGKYYLRKYGFVASGSDIEVPLNIKKKYNLSNFDVVEVISSGEAFKIISINGEETENIENNEKLGTKQVFHLSTKEEINKEIKNLIEQNEKMQLKTLVFSSNTFKGDKVVSIKAEEKKTNALTYKLFVSFVNECEKCVLDGETIVAVTDESDMIERVIDSFKKDVSGRIKKHLQEQINELLALGNELVILKMDKETIYQ